MYCTISEVIHLWEKKNKKQNRCQTGDPYSRTKATNVGYSAFFSKMGCYRPCSEEQCTKLIGEEKTQLRKMIGCSAKIISNALKYQLKPERCVRKLLFKWVEEQQK